MSSSDERGADRDAQRVSKVVSALPWLAAGLAVVLLWLVLSPEDGSSKPSMRLGRVVVTPRSAEPGDRIRVRSAIRNAAGVQRRARVVVSLSRTRGARSRIVIARRLLKTLMPGSRGRFALGATVPRRLAPARYYVFACIRNRGGSGVCRLSRRRLRVVPRVGGPPGGPGVPRGTVYQTIDGFGTSSRVFEDPHAFGVNGPAPPTTTAQRDAVFDALYVDLGLTRIRPVQPDTAAGPPPIGIEPQNDNSDPNATDSSRFNFSGRRLDLHAAHVIRAKARGVTVAWTSPLNREVWMGVTTSQDAAEYAEWLLAQVRRFKQQGAPLDYISVANEPSYSRNTMSGKFIRDVIKNLGPRLAAEGLRVPFVVPDDVRASNSAAKASTILADPAARRYVGALATHLYDEPVTRVASMSSLAKTYGLPLWMTEFALGGMDTAGRGGQPIDWTLLMHDLLVRYDLAAIDYFWGFSGVGEEATLITLNYTGGTYTGFTRNKVYYYLGQYSRFVRPGAQRVSVSTSDDRIRISAYYRGDTRVLVAINPGDSSVTTRLTAPDLVGVSSMKPTRTSGTENWAALARVDVSAAGLTATLPARSVTTFSGTAGQ